MAENSDLSKYLNWIKLPPRYLFSIALVCFVMLFGPASLLARLGAQVFVNTYRMWIGVVFLGASSLLIPPGFMAAWKVGKKYLERKRLRRDRQSQLRNLTTDEKRVLAKFVLEDKACLRFHIGDGIINALVLQQIAYRPSNVGIYHTDFEFVLQPWVWDELRTDPTLLEPTYSELAKEYEDAPKG